MCLVCNRQEKKSRGTASGFLSGFKHCPFIKCFKRNMYVAAVWINQYHLMSAFGAFQGVIAKGTGYAGPPAVKAFEDRMPVFLDGAA